MGIQYRAEAYPIMKCNMSGCKESYVPESDYYVEEEQVLESVIAEGWRCVKLQAYRDVRTGLILRSIIVLDIEKEAIEPEFHGLYACPSCEKRGESPDDEKRILGFALIEASQALETFQEETKASQILDDLGVANPEIITKHMTLQNNRLAALDALLLKLIEFDRTPRFSEFEVECNLGHFTVYCSPHWVHLPTHERHQAVHIVRKNTLLYDWQRHYQFYKNGHRKEKHRFECFGPTEDQYKELAFAPGDKILVSYGDPKDDTFREYVKPYMAKEGIILGLERGSSFEDAKEGFCLWLVEFEGLDDGAFHEYEIEKVSCTSEEQKE